MRYIAMLLILALFAPAVADAKGSSGGRSSGGSRSASSSRSVSTPKTTTNAPSKPSTPKPAPAPKVSTKPTSATKSVDAPEKTTSTGKKTTGKASVVDDTYKPRFKGGYVPPNGSTVQYVERNASFIDYLPWIYIFSMSHRQNVTQQEAVVTEPDGTEKTVIMEDEGTDGLLILNWIIMILLAGGLVYGIMWSVNKFTMRKSYV